MRIWRGLWSQTGHRLRSGATLQPGAAAGQYRWRGAAPSPDRLAVLQGGTLLRPRSSRANNRPWGWCSASRNGDLMAHTVPTAPPAATGSAPGRVTHRATGVAPGCTPHCSMEAVERGERCNCVGYDGRWAPLEELRIAAVSPAMVARRGLTLSGRPAATG